MANAVIPGPPVEDAVSARFVAPRPLVIGDVGPVDVAFDRTLGRQVALREPRLAGPAQLREVQAQAGLAHPGVARIFEVVRTDGRMLVVMEWIRGDTLRAWRASQARPRWRAVLEHFVAAGEGLAAAHAVGLIHGAFGLDSAVVDASGRVRVLACAAALREDAEDEADRVATPADDVRGLCAALAEALGGVRAPGWLRRIAARGQEPAPPWGSMAALLAALRAARARRRRLVVAALGAAIAGGAIGLTRNLTSDSGRCDAATTALVGIWDDARREEVRRALLGSGAGAAEAVWPRVRARLDAYAAGWSRAYAEVCAAGERGDAERLVDRSMACLGRRRASLAALVDVLGQADAATALKASAAAEALPSVAACTDVAALRAAAPPPDDPARAEAVERLREQLARGQALADAGQSAAGLARVESVLAAAQPLGYEPLVAEAKLQKGRMLIDAWRVDEAAEALSDAVWAALPTRLDDIAAEALARRIYALRAVPARRPELHADVALVEALTARLGPHGRWIEGELRNNLGTLYTAEGRPELAQRAFERALAIKAEVFGADHPQYAHSLNNLGSVLLAQGRLEAARAHFERATALLRAAFGPHHPQVALGLNNIAATYIQAGDWAGAEPYVEAYYEALASAFPDGAELVWPRLLVARLHQEQGRFAAARAHADAARSLAVRRGDAIGVVRTEVARAHLELAAGAVDVADAIFRGIVARPGALQVDDDLRLTALRFALARALWDRPAERSRALELAATAASSFRAYAPYTAAELAEVEAWRRAHEVVAR
ncbi:tetratricopeptide repeat-containing protein kinase family protein [Nannocystis exedens]|nr:tetratricopeptide repeat-containing protein kinase family protein [Nannocystis exedens]